MKIDEHSEQAAVFERASLHLRKYPEMELLFAIPNGGYRPGKTGGTMKAEGAKPGVPDMFLPVQRGEYAGLFIEMKVKGGSIRDIQEQWIFSLRNQGYRVDVCWGQDDAMATLLAYLDGKLKP